MARIIWILASLVMVGSVSAGESSSAALPAEEAAQAIVNAMIEGWNAGDGEAFAAHFAKDATYRVWNGRFSDGRESIAAAHQRIFDTFYAGTKLWMEIERVRSITDRVALVYTRGQLSRDGKNIEPLPGMQGGVPLLILVREGQEWVVVHFQNTPNLPPPNSAPERSPSH